MKVWCVFKYEAHVGDLLMKLFTTQDKAEEYKELCNRIDSDDDNTYTVEEWIVE